MFIDELIVLFGDGFDDDFVVLFQWDVVLMLFGVLLMFIGVDGLVLEFRFRICGSYVFRLMVTDFDMAIDFCEVGVLVIGFFEVVCFVDVMGPMCQLIRLNAIVIDDLGICTCRWEVIWWFVSSSVELMFVDVDVIMIILDCVGVYIFCFMVMDVEGLSALCEVDVMVMLLLFIFICLGMVMIELLCLMFISVSVVDDGMVVSWRWCLTSTSGGSGVMVLSSVNVLMMIFILDIVGVYELMVIVIDDDGFMGMCIVCVEVGNVDGFWVEMFWDIDFIDMDLYLMCFGGM